MIPKTKLQSNPAMPRTRIAPNGPVFSRMVYGTWRMLDDAPSTQDINRRLHLCLDLGISTIDGAEIYGGYAQEAALGAAMGWAATAMMSTLSIAAANSSSRKRMRAGIRSSAR